MRVLSTGSKPRSELPQSERFWNSTGWAAMYGTSSLPKTSSAALASL